MNPMPAKKSKPHPQPPLDQHLETLRAIAKVITQQKALEKHQRSTHASVNTLQDSMVYAYDQIIEIMQPFLQS